jgi:C-type lysozyme/alpha-lactalbumin family
MPWNWFRKILAWLLMDFSSYPQFSFEVLQIKMSKFASLVIFAIIAAGVQVHAKVFESCDLMEELIYMHNATVDMAEKLTCFAKRSTGLDTQFSRGNESFGIFNIKRDLVEMCNISVSQLTDNDIADDFACAMKIAVVDVGEGRDASCGPMAVKCRGASAETTKKLEATTSSPATNKTESLPAPKANPTEPEKPKPRFFLPDAGTAIFNEAGVDISKLPGGNTRERLEKMNLIGMISRRHTQPNLKIIFVFF